MSQGAIHDPAGLPEGFDCESARKDMSPEDRQRINWWLIGRARAMKSATHYNRAPMVLNNYDRWLLFNPTYVRRSIEELQGAALYGSFYSELPATGPNT